MTNFFYDPNKIPSQSPTDTRRMVITGVTENYDTGNSVIVASGGSEGSGSSGGTPEDSVRDIPKILWLRPQEIRYSYNPNNDSYPIVCWLDSAQGINFTNQDPTQASIELEELGAGLLAAKFSYQPSPNDLVAEHDLGLYGRNYLLTYGLIHRDKDSFAERLCKLNGLRLGWHQRDNYLFQGQALNSANTSLYLGTGEVVPSFKRGEWHLVKYRLDVHDVTITVIDDENNYSNSFKKNTQTGGIYPTENLIYLGFEGWGVGELHWLGELMISTERGVEETLDNYFLDLMAKYRATGVQPT